ncbi:hypothetical protein AMECASPLE_001895 [Ameca splendens]|uniref:Uncharacterized protein n=1 Tax=Ameca splendens TaxID=208324 RepID=A0ABV0ZJT6_9TELE
MERGARACMTQTLPLFVCVCGSRRGRCTRLIVGHFKLYCHVFQLVHLSRHVDSVPKSQITKKESLQNTPLRRVPTMPHPFSLRGVSSQPDSPSALSSSLPPTLLNMINRPSENKHRGSPVQRPGPQHAQAPLCPANDSQHPLRPPAPDPLPPKNKHLIEKASF